MGYICFAFHDLKNTRGKNNCKNMLRVLSSYEWLKLQKKVNICVCVYIYKVKQSRYRPGVAQRLPGS
jgi:hypothetical protein